MPSEHRGVKCEDTPYPVSCHTARFLFSLIRRVHTHIHTHACTQSQRATHGTWPKCLIGRRCVCGLCAAFSEEARATVDATQRRRSHTATRAGYIHAARAPNARSHSVANKQLNGVRECASDKHTLTHRLGWSEMSVTATGVDFLCGVEPTTRRGGNTNYFQASLLVCLCLCLIWFARCNLGFLVEVYDMIVCN